MVGYDQRDLKTKRFLDITHPKDVEASRQAFQDLLAGRCETFDLEKRYVRKDGKDVERKWWCEVPSKY